MCSHRSATAPLSLALGQKFTTMSLIVNTYTRTPDGRMDIIEVDHSEELAGFERCRQDLWGHISVRALGLVILPTLANSDIYAEGEAIVQLERDTNLILTNVSAVVEATQYTSDFVIKHCQNILRAIRLAHEIKGGVVIW